MIAAPIRPDRLPEVRALLATMNQRPGLADPNNPLVPFGRFETLHFARFIVLKDDTIDDLAVYGTSFTDAPIYLAFLGDCDGSAETLLADFVNRAGDGLRRIFSYCDGFTPGADLLTWLRQHSVKPAASYVNWIGRTARQIHEEAALHEALIGYLRSAAPHDAPRAIHGQLARLVREQGPRLTQEGPTPLGWRLRQLLYIVAAAVAALVVLLPLLALPLPSALKVYGIAFVVIAVAVIVLLVILRRHETTDPDILTPPTGEHLVELGAIQDVDITNQYNAFGSLKPGWFRRTAMATTLWLINVVTPILYPRGNLGRVQTIHFARWVFLDDKRRVYFASNYDGSAESYMDDFVNKVPYGLNLAFSHGLGYPRTAYLLSGGAMREQEFKNTQRRHSLTTDVWYKAYPGLSLFDIGRNARIRQGLESTTMTDADVQRWLAEI